VGRSKEGRPAKLICKPRQTKNDEQQKNEGPDREACVQLGPKEKGKRKWRRGVGGGFKTCTSTSSVGGGKRVQKGKPGGDGWEEAKGLSKGSKGDGAFLVLSKNKQKKTTIPKRQNTTWPTKMNLFRVR